MYHVLSLGRVNKINETTNEDRNTRNTSIWIRSLNGCRPQVRVSRLMSLYYWHCPFMFVFGNDHFGWKGGGCSLQQYSVNGRTFSAFVKQKYDECLFSSSWVIAHSHSLHTVDRRCRHSIVLWLTSITTYHVYQWRGSEEYCIFIQYRYKFVRKNIFI